MPPSATSLRASAGGRSPGAWDEIPARYARLCPNRDIEDRTRVLIGSWGCDVLTGGRGTTRSAARTGTTGAPARSSSRGCCAAVPRRRRPPGQGPRGIWRCTVTRCRAAGRFGTGPGTSQAVVVGLVSQLPRRVRRCRLASAGQSRCRVVHPSGTTAFADKIAPVRFAWVGSAPVRSRGVSNGRHWPSKARQHDHHAHPRCSGHGGAGHGGRDRAAVEVA
jgi:hypothetical protein